MKLLIYTLLVALIALGLAGKLDKCHYGGLTLAPGEEMDSRDQCMLVKCIDSCKLSFTQCAYQRLEPPCDWGDQKYPDEAFPKCCERDVVCPEGYHRKCHYGGYTLSFGEEVQLTGECARIRCLDDGDVIKNVCGDYTGIPSECRLGDYKYRDEAFPTCCEKEIICPDGMIVQTIRKRN